MRWAHEINPASASQFTNAPALARQTSNTTPLATSRFLAISVTTMSPNLGSPHSMISRDSLPRHPISRKFVRCPCLARKVGVVRASAILTRWTAPRSGAKNGDSVAELPPPGSAGRTWRRRRSYPDQRRTLLVATRLWSGEMWAAGGGARGSRLPARPGPQRSFKPVRPRCETRSSHSSGRR